MGCGMQGCMLLLAVGARLTCQSQLLYRHERRWRTVASPAGQGKIEVWLAEEAGWEVQLGEVKVWYQQVSAERGGSNSSH